MMKPLTPFTSRCSQHVAGWRLRTLLLCGMALVAALVVVSSIVVVASTSSMKQAAAAIATDSLPKASWAYEVSIEVNAMALALRDAVLIEMQEDLPVEVERLKASEKRIAERLDKLQALVSAPEETELLLAVQSSAKSFAALTKDYVHQLEGGARGPARGMLTGSLRKAQAEYLAALLSFRALQSSKVEGRVEAVVSGMQGLQWRSMVAFAAIVLVGLLVALALMGLLARRLGAEPAEVAQTMSQVADGHLDIRLPRAGIEGSVVHSLRTMVDKLGEAVRDVRAGAEEVSRQSKSIEQDSRHLSNRTEQQAADLEEASATLEEFAAAITQSAGAVQGADQLALEASKVSEHSQRTIDEAVTAMGRVGDSSQKISEITSVIDSLAFQTNILALNAAVEAARAGEHGRGFGVVASEVRQLAQYSANAAREIRDLISVSAEHVRSGKTLVQKARQESSEVIRAVEAFAHLMSGLRKVAGEQAAGVRQLNEALSRIDQFTQQNAALVDGSGQAASDLLAQADRLLLSVSRFRLG